MDATAMPGHRVAVGRRLAMLAACALAFPALAAGQQAVTTDPALDALERQLETTRHAQLLATIAAYAGGPSAFTTDGCSGGLSAGWEQVAAQFPEFAARHGPEPPWQSCCIVHDRRYHIGGGTSATAMQSFDARKAADLDLAACVVETGVARSDPLRAAYSLSPAQVIGLYKAIAELMYRAVRLGGIPCTNESWRWGYGWPRCRQPE